MEWPAGVATSVLVTYMSAHEQSNIPVTMARNDFIRLFGKLPSHPMTGEKANRRVCDATLVPPEAKIAKPRYRAIAGNRTYGRELTDDYRPAGSGCGSGSRRARVSSMRM